MVTWASSKDEDGFVEWALNATDLSSRSGTFAIAADVRGLLSGRLNQKTHRVEVVGATAGATIHYQPVSGGGAAPGGPYQAVLPSVPLNAAPVGITGAVTYQGGSPGRECLVYLRVDRVFSGQVLRSLHVIAMTDGDLYATDIKNIRSALDPDTPLSYGPDSDDATIHVRAVCDAEREGSILRTTADADKLRVAGAVSEYQNMDVVVSAAAAP